MQSESYYMYCLETFGFHFVTGSHFSARPHGLPLQSATLKAESFSVALSGNVTFYYKKTRIFSQEVVKENYNLLVYSATRLPTNHKSHDLLQRDIFPITAGNTPVGDLWNMMVFYKVSNKKGSKNSNTLIITF